MDFTIFHHEKVEGLTVAAANPSVLLAGTTRLELAASGVTVVFGI